MVPLYNLEPAFDIFGFDLIELPEDFAIGGELGVRFKADDDFVPVDQLDGLFGHVLFAPAAYLDKPAGWRRWKSVASCSLCAALSRRASWK